MKTITKLLIAVSILFPLITSATTTVPWISPTSGGNLIQPTIFSGATQGINIGNGAFEVAPSGDITSSSGINSFNSTIESFFNTPRFIVSGFSNYIDGLISTDESNGGVAIGDVGADHNSTAISILDDNSDQDIVENANNGYTFNGGSATFNGIVNNSGYSVAGASSPSITSGGLFNYNIGGFFTPLTDSTGKLYAPNGLYQGSTAVVDGSDNGTFNNLTVNGNIIDSTLTHGANGQYLKSTGGAGDVWTTLPSAITAIGPLNQTLTNSTIILATSSTPFNGLTASTTITASGATITFKNTLAGILGVGGGGTGSTTLSGILIGNGTSPVNTLTVGSGLSLSGTTLSATGSGTVGSGTTGQYPYYASSGTTLTATSTIFLGTNSSVGINTASPSATTKLDIAANNINGVRVYDGTNVGSSIGLFTTSVGTNQSYLTHNTYFNGTNWVAYDGSVGADIFNMDNTGNYYWYGNPAPGSTYTPAALMFLDATHDRLGIGDTNPTTPLDVNGAGTFRVPSGGVALNFTNFSDADLNLGATAPGAGDKYSFIYPSTPTSLVFGTNATERMRLLNNGNFGIGTTSPFAKLSVVGDSLVTGTSTASRFINSTGNPSIAGGTGGGSATPTLSASSDDSGGTISVTTGVAPSASAVISTLTFVKARTANCTFSPANAATALLSGTSMVFITNNGTNFTLTAGTVALTGITAYSWSYTCHE